MVKGSTRKCKDEEQSVVPYEQTKHERMEKYNNYKEIVRKAIEDGKIFRVISTMDITKIRMELKQRGYIETISHTWNNKFYQMSNRELLDLAEPGNQYEQALLSKMIEGFMPDYLWVTQPRLYGIYKNVPYMNKIQIEEHVDWGFKDGMLKCMQEVQRVCGDEIVRNHYSRSYIMTGLEDFEEFNQDYRFTMATSLIKFIITQNNPHDIFHPSYGKVKSSVIDLALKIIQDYIAMYKTGTKFKIDRDNDLTESRWLQVKTSHILLLKRKEKIKESSEERIEHLMFRMKMFLDEIEEIWPERKYDGHSNLWLLKPTYMGEGIGIVITDNDLSISEVVEQKRSTKYVIQKYIERPLLIYNTKSDIRQYFLIQIDSNVLRVWCSPISSIKFASCEFNLRCFHEAIHITNTAVQMKYKNRSKNPLPQDHLWSIYDFTNHLSRNGDKFLWRDVIYPQMKKVIIEIVKGSWEYIDKKPGRFELFGCDWILTHDYKPILLEINRPPSLEYYTPVSGIVCGQIMEDIIRVTVDYAKSSYAYTGSFEIIYERKIFPDRSATSTPIPTSTSEKASHSTKNEKENSKKVKREVKFEQKTQNKKENDKNELKTDMQKYMEEKELTSEDLKEIALRKILGLKRPKNMVTVDKKKATNLKTVDEDDSPEKFKQKRLSLLNSTPKEFVGAK